MKISQLKKIAGANHDDIIDTWKTPGRRDFGYFDTVDSAAQTAGFWREGGLFRKRFDLLNIERTVEIACGFGRHSAQFVDRPQQMLLVDTSVGAVAEASKRFSQYPHVRVALSEDGMSIPAEDGSFTAVFSYDAMVHFEPVTVAAYLQEASRVLEPGGMVLFHHSNYEGNPTGHFQSSPSWRNYMSKDLFAHFASRAGLEVVDRITMQWGGVPDLDCLSLMRKPE